MKVRATTTNGKKEVVGWYYHSCGHHYVVVEGEHGPTVFEIDHQTAGVLTGKLDRTKREIAGSWGELTGGDRIMIGSIGPEEVVWDGGELRWRVRDNAGRMGCFHDFRPDEIEIIEE
jgi:hypothetical protein